MDISFSNPLLKSVRKDAPQIPQTVTSRSPLLDEKKIKEARAFLDSRGITDMKPLFRKVNKEAN